MWQGCKPSNGTKLFLEKYMFHYLWYDTIAKNGLWVFHACLWIYISSLQIIIGGASKQY